MQCMAFRLQSLWKPKALNDLRCPPTRTAVNHLRSDPDTAEFGQCVKKQLCILSAQAPDLLPPLSFLAGSLSHSHTLNIITEQSV